MTPEQIVAEWLQAYDPQTHSGLSPLRLTERIRAYGDACAERERDRCIDVVRAYGWRADAAEVERIVATSLIHLLRSLTTT